MFDAQAGAVESIDAWEGRMADAVRRHAIVGLTVVGGEPLEQPLAVAALCERAHGLGLATLVFTGFTFAQARHRPGFSNLLRHVDTLVDGPFDPRRREPVEGRRFVGSTNQRILHRTLRQAGADNWRGTRPSEAIVHPDGSLSVVGFPTEVRRLVRGLSHVQGRRLDGS